MPLSNIFISLLSLFTAVVSAQDPTYHNDIKPILEKHCMACHKPGEVGPMPLTTFEEVSSYGTMIKYVTSTRLMPPWYADPSYNHFANERVLSNDEINKIENWVNTGMKEGTQPYGREISSTVSVTVLPREPDLILSMKEAFEQYGIYMDQYQAFVIPTKLTDDKWVEGIEFVPGNKKIVRFASVAVASEGRFDSLDKWDPRYGYYSFGGLGMNAQQPYWYTWSPQQKLTFFSAGSAKFLPKHSELIVHIHYGPTGFPQKDSSQIRLYFTEKKIDKPIRTIPFVNPQQLTNDSFLIEANAVNIFHSQTVIPQSIQLLSLTPQANLLCRSWELFAKIPGDAEPVKLLKIRDWNFNWKQTYYFTSPVTLPAGTVLHALAHYDNTLDNPCNPADDPVPFRLGPYLFNELFYVHFEYIPQSPYAIQLGASTVTDGSPLQLSIAATSGGSYQIEITSPDQCEDAIVRQVELHKGNQSLDIDVAGLADGNYVLEVIDEKQIVVAKHLFVKMKNHGM